MKYEFILKIKESNNEPFKIKYRCVLDEWQETTMSRYKDIGSKYIDYVILVNELDDNNELIQTII